MLFFPGDDEDDDLLRLVMRLVGREIDSTLFMIVRMKGAKQRSEKQRKYRNKEISG